MEKWGYLYFIVSIHALSASRAPRRTPRREMILIGSLQELFYRPHPFVMQPPSLTHKIGRHEPRGKTRQREEVPHGSQHQNHDCRLKVWRSGSQSDLRQQSHQHRPLVETYVSRFVIRNSIDCRLLSMQTDKIRTIDRAMQDTDGSIVEPLSMADLASLFGHLRE
jgi:hypothetical protein